MYDSGEDEGGTQEEQATSEARQRWSGRDEAVLDCVRNLTRISLCSVCADDNP